MIKTSVRKAGLFRLVLALVAVMLTAGTAFAQQITAELDGRQLYFDQPPVMQEGRVLVPMRGIFESMGADVVYEPATRTVKATREGRVIELQLGSRTAYVNGQANYLDVPANTISGRTMVPLRFVSEALGADVRWIAATRTVAIESPGMAQQPQQPQQPTAQRPTIHNISHNARQTLNQGDLLRVTMTGTPGGTASFDILGVVNDILMQETSSGVYEGNYQIPAAVSASAGTLVVELRKDGMVAQEEADRSVAISTQYPDTGQQLDDMMVSPQSGSVVQTNRPLVQANFERPVRPETIELFLDGRNVTSQANRTYNTVSYLPNSNLNRGLHTVTVRATDTAGNYIAEQWTFQVDQYAGTGTPGYGPNLTVTNLGSGQTVPAVFNVQGITEPYATVQITVQSTRSLIPGVIGVRGRTLERSVVANANGRFDVQIDASSLSEDSELDVSVVAIGQNGQRSDTVELDLARR